MLYLTCEKFKSGNLGFRMQRCRRHSGEGWSLSPEPGSRTVAGILVEYKHPSASSGERTLRERHGPAMLEVESGADLGHRGQQFLGCALPVCPSHKAGIEPPPPCHYLTDTHFKLQQSSFQNPRERDGLLRKQSRWHIWTCLDKKEWGRARAA